MSEGRDRDYLEDMLKAIEDALDFTESMDEEEFLEDRKTCSAVARSIEVMGEAAKRVSGATKAAHPHVPWRKIAGMRDKLIHDYGNVDFAYVWAVVDDQLGPLADNIRLALSEFEESGGEDETDDGEDEDDEE